MDLLIMLPIIGIESLPLFELNNNVRMTFYEIALFMFCHHLIFKKFENI
jgi:hypothetical protein